MALSILIGNAVFLRYLCRCNGKVRRCHIAPSPACLLYILAAGGYGGECTDWLPGGRSFRTEEILYGYCAEHTLFRTGRTLLIVDLISSFILVFWYTVKMLNSIPFTGWRIIISVPGAMSIKRRFLQA